MANHRHILRLVNAAVALSAVAAIAVSCSGDEFTAASSQSGVDTDANSSGGTTGATGGKGGSGTGGSHSGGTTSSGGSGETTSSGGSGNVGGNGGTGGIGGGSGGMLGSGGVGTGGISSGGSVGASGVGGSGGLSGTGGTGGGGTGGSGTGGSSTGGSSTGGTGGGSCATSGQSCDGLITKCCAGLSCCTGGPSPSPQIAGTGGLYTIGVCQALCPISDRNLKKAFQSIDPDDVLERVSRLPISSWSYKTEQSSVRHIGPMAQDFMACFGVGSDDRTIQQVDADGIALASIQALNTRLQRLEAENRELLRSLGTLSARVDELESRVCTTPSK